MVAANPRSRNSDSDASSSFCLALGPGMNKAYRLVGMSSSASIPTHQRAHSAPPSATPSTNWTPLPPFLDDEKLPPDNNASDSALRVVALGRKNYLFVGNEDAGNNVAGLYSLVATCEANGVNPLDYLSDVLLRDQDHRAAEIDDLRPHRWRPRSA